jgi:hypothetical protein
MSDAALKKWKTKNCPKDIHCFDEVLSDSDHYLVCDSCGLCCHISGIETEKQSLERIAKEHAGQALGKLILPKKPAKANGHCNMGGA